MGQISIHQMMARPSSRRSALPVRANNPFGARAAVRSKQRASNPSPAASRASNCGCSKGAAEAPAANPGGRPHPNPFGIFPRTYGWAGSAWPWWGYPRTSYAYQWGPFQPRALSYSYAWPYTPPRYPLYWPWWGATPATLSVRTAAAA